MSFKTDLMETLIATDGQAVDIQPLVMANCVDTDGIYGNDCTKCRLGVLTILEELKTMNWITIGGNDYGFNLTVHQFDMDQGKKDYSSTPIWVRLSTKGKIEYKESIAPPIQSTTNNTLTVSGDNYGQIIQNSDLRELKTRTMSPTTNNNNNTGQTKQKTLWLQWVAWITGSIAALIAIYKFFIQK